MENRVEKYKNWEYKINFSKDVNKFEINYPNKKLDPDTLSKYYSINECSIESIENNNFYVSQPEDFNDLFDTAYNILDFNQLYLNCILSLSPKNQEENIRHHWETHKEFFINSIKKDSYRALLARFGILCTTENKLNELMWGYYNNNEGFLLEFNYKEFPKNFHGPFPINYVKTIDKIKTNNIDHLTFLLQSNIKKDIWKHENEYRFLVESDSEYLKVRGIWEDSELDRLRIE